MSLTFITPKPFQLILESWWMFALPKFLLTLFRCYVNENMTDGWTTWRKYASDSVGCCWQWWIKKSTRKNKSKRGNTDHWEKHQHYPRASFNSLVQHLSPSIFVLHIQEVTHWEMSSKRVATPDRALDSPLVCGHPGLKGLQLLHLMSIPCVLIEKLQSWHGFICCCVVSHVFFVMPGVLRIWQPTPNSAVIPQEYEDHHSCVQWNGKAFCLCNRLCPYKVFWYLFSTADL